MGFKPIKVDRTENSYDRVGGIITYLCDYEADVSSLPTGLPTDAGTVLALPGSIAIVADPKSLYVLNTQHEWKNMTN